MDGRGRFVIGSTVRDLAHQRGIVRGNARFRPKGSDVTASEVPHVLVELDDQYTIWINAKYLTVEPGERL